MNEAILDQFASLISRDHVGGQINVRQLPCLVEMKVGAFQRIVCVRRAIIILHSVAVRLDVRNDHVPFFPVGTELVRAQCGVAAVDHLRYVIRLRTPPPRKLLTRTR
jgi:hypothetical protein